MKLTIIPFLLPLAAYAIATPAKRDQFSDNVLTAHNRYRRQYGAAPLTYDNNLASGAASYARGCHWGHSSGGYGENLAASTDPNYSVQAAVQSWVGESQMYKYNIPGFSMQTGHFTQVVWKGTKSVGCGVHRCNTGSPIGSGDWTYIVCRYSPAGNVVGQFADNVGRP